MVDGNLMVQLAGAVAIAIALAVWQVLALVQRRQGCGAQITRRSIDRTSRRVTTER